MMGIRALLWSVSLGAVWGQHAGDGCTGCPYQYDGQCDVDLGTCRCDPFDCSPCAAALTCDACTSIPGCVFCAADSLCVHEGHEPSPSFLRTLGKTTTCEEGDYVASCPPRGDSPVGDPFYEAQAWFLEAMRVPEAWARGYR